MKNFIKKLLILLLFLMFSPLFGQPFGTGAILDPDLYEQTELKPVLHSRSYGSPRLVSLKDYCPEPGYQGQYPTCVGWASAYAARTISESVTFNRTDRTETSNNVFSPNHIYIGHYLRMGITREEINRCNGASIRPVLDYMRDVGAVKMLSSERTTDFPLIMFPAFADSRLYRIDRRRLFDAQRGVPGTEDERVTPVKRSLEERKPVIIGMNLPPSFTNFGTDVWRPRPNEDPNVNYRNGHAMCVVGYDDDMYGGAFEILNSWGTNWANRGYVWIRYSDFAAFVDEAYELIEIPDIYREEMRFAASIEIEIRPNREGMPVTFDRQGFYKTNSSYPSGTEFRYLMRNRHPAYVYGFSADSSTAVIRRIFPLRGVSPLLDYPNGTIAWPGEYRWIRLDNTTGTDYLIVLYSKQALDIEAIERRFAAERGAFPERVARAVEAVVGTNNFIPYANVQYNNTAIEFTAESYNPRSVFGLLLAIDHR